jgi:eukaryotic-like serine/threonine-protein kinase
MTIDGKYRIVSELGRGGMGVVYEAVHLALGHRVALKFLAEDSVHSEAVVARFVREARAGANIASEHVARVFDLGMTEDNVPYLVMELLEGDDLANVLAQRGALGIDDAVRIGLQACAAMSESHALGIIHRDLKPENVFLQARRGAAPIVKILDFGLAKIEAQDDAAKTESQLVFGTPRYMAPEQLKSTANAGPEADVWSLGVVLYEMLSGRKPFDGAIMSVVIAEVLTKDARPLRELRPDLPSGLEDAVMRCLERDPARRPTIVELAELLLPFAPAGCTEIAARVKATTRAEWTEAPANRLRDLVPSPRTLLLRKNEWAIAVAVCAALFMAGFALSFVHSRGQSTTGVDVR